jgi:hypothetical protein
VSAGTEVDRPRRARRRRTALVATAVVVVAAAAATGATLAVRAHPDPSTAPTTRVTAPTTTVIRTDLSDTQTLAGTLGFGTPTPLTGRGSGTVTSLPAPGAVLDRGQVLYRVDDQPVVVLFGGTPLFRTLSIPTPPPTTPPTAPPTTPATPTVTMHGTDVSVVADNLAALGYDIGRRSTAADGTTLYTHALAAAVKRWQAAIGMDPTGTLGVGQVVVVPGLIRVSSIAAQLGDPVDEVLMSVTATAKVVTVPVDATALGGIVTGAQVTVGLPDGRQVPATVTAIGRSARAPTGQLSAGGSGQADSTIEVTVTPAQPADVAQLDAAPVQVQFTTTTHPHVLAVPVTALLALSGGGYALERADGTLIRVRTGMFAHGMVEVTGDGLTAGLMVGTAP